MKPAPKTIYLQDCDPNCNEEPTWCVDKIEETDVEYIRKDLYQELYNKYRALELTLAQDRRNENF